MEHKETADGLSLQGAFALFMDERFEAAYEAATAHDGGEDEESTHLWECLRALSWLRVLRERFAELTRVEDTQKRAEKRRDWLGQVEEAVGLCQKVLARDEKLPELWFACAWGLSMLSRLDEAEEALGRGAQASAAAQIPPAAYVPSPEAFREHAQLHAPGEDEDDGISTPTAEGELSDDELSQVVGGAAPAGMLGADMPEAAARRMMSEFARSGFSKHETNPIVKALRKENSSLEVRNPLDKGEQDQIQQQLQLMVRRPFARHSWKAVTTSEEYTQKAAQQTASAPMDAAAQEALQALQAQKEELEAKINSLPNGEERDAVLQEWFQISQDIANASA